MMNKILNKRIGEIKLFLRNILKTLKIIWQSSKLITSFLLFATILEGALLPINMIISKYLIDSVANILAANNEGSMNKVFMWLFFQFIAAIFLYVLNQLRGYLYQYQSKLLNINISESLMEKNNELDVSYFEDDEFYDNIEKANDESISRSFEILDLIILLVKNVASLIGAAVIVFTLNPYILIISFIASIPIFLVNVKLSKKIYDVFDKRIQEARFARHLRRIMIHPNNIKEIKIYRLGNYFQDNILSIFREHLNQDKRVGKLRLKELTAVGILNSIISYSFKLYVVFMTIKNGLTIGSMTMYISALSNVDESIKSVLDNIVSLYANNLYIENLFSVLDLKPKIDNDLSLPPINKKILSSIEFRNVSFKYPNTDKYVLKDINLKIYSNETCAIVGLNGSGKTTMVKLLARLYDPTEGEIYIDGKNIKEYNLESLYKYISIVFQDFMKYPFTVKDNIGFGNIDKVKNMDLIKSAAEKSGASEFIKKLPSKYDTKLEKSWTGGTDLSLGQWQKLAISRAFMNDSSIIVLDEPTASLDAEAEYKLFQNFKELIGNSTCVLISHRFSTVKMADRIYVINDGSVVEAGDHKSLIREGGLYAQLFNMQAEAYNIEEIL